jgi:hypothetical protein
MAEALNHEILAGQLNTKFVLNGTDQPIELELIEVTAPTVQKSQTYFSLFFRGSREFMLPQGTYEMTHERLGTVYLFIVPTALEADGYRYEAVFNLLNESSAGAKV